MAGSANIFLLSLSDWASTIGLICEIVGVFLAAKQFLNMETKWEDFKSLVDAIWRGKKARGAVAVANMSDDFKLYALQGFSLIALGFILQLVGIILKQWSL